MQVIEVCQVLVSIRKTYKSYVVCYILDMMCANYYWADLGSLMLMQFMQERIMCMDFGGITRKFVDAFIKQKEEY